MRRKPKVTPWARRRRKALILLVAVLVLVSPWLVWRLNIKSELREAREGLRAAGVPMTMEERAAWLTQFPKTVPTELFQEAAAVYVPLPFEIMDHMPTFRSRHEEAHLFERPYPEERVAALRDAVHLNEAALKILLRAGELPPDARAVEQYPSDELVELYCIAAYVGAAEGDGARAAEAVRCGLRYLECTSAPYSGAPRWAYSSLDRLVNALFSAASQTALPDDSLRAIRDMLDPTGWEEQYRTARIDSTSQWLIDSQDITMDGSLLVSNILFGIFDRYYLSEMEVVTKGILPMTGMTEAEQDAYRAAHRDESWGRLVGYVAPPTHLEVARLGIDIVRIDQKTGTLPSDLSALVPQYREAIPRNEFRGNDYVYTAEGRRFEIGDSEEDPSERSRSRRGAVSYQANLPPR